MIKNTLMQPDLEAYGNFERLIAIKRLNDRYLKVVYTKEANTYVIITVMWQI